MDFAGKTVQSIEFESVFGMRGSNDPTSIRNEN